MDAFSGYEELLSFEAVLDKVDLEEKLREFNQFYDKKRLYEYQNKFTKTGFFTYSYVYILTFISIVIILFLLGTDLVPLTLISVLFVAPIILVLFYALWTSGYLERSAIRRFNISTQQYKDMYNLRFRKSIGMTIATLPIEFKYNLSYSTVYTNVKQNDHVKVNSDKYNWDSIKGAYIFKDYVIFDMRGWIMNIKLLNFSPEQSINQKVEQIIKSKVKIVIDLRE